MATASLLCQAVGIILVTSFVSVSSEKILCYICSYSPKDNRTEEWCTRRSFKPEMVQTIHCAKGCEQVEKKDPNGAVELFYRNCYTSNKTLEETCRYTDSKSHTSHRCVCATDLCNTASTTASTLPLLIVVLIIALTLWTKLIR